MQYDFILRDKSRSHVNKELLSISQQYLQSTAAFTMEKASHLSVIVDLSPTQWHLSAQASNQYPLSIEVFLCQLLAFLNAHIAAKHENTLVVFGAFPGKRWGPCLRVGSFLTAGGTV